MKSLCFVLFEYDSIFLSPAYHVCLKYGTGLNENNVRKNMTILFFVFLCLTRTSNKPKNINVMNCRIKSLLFRVNYWYFICHLNSLIKYCDWPKAKQNGSIQDQLNQIEIPTWFREWNTTACLNAWRFFIWIFVWFWCGSSNEHRVLNIEYIFCTIVRCCTFLFFFSFQCI